MLKVIVERDSNRIRLADIDDGILIFAKKNDKLVGMVINEDSGWILRIGVYNLGATGHHKTRDDCIKSCIKHDYIFFVED